MPYTRAADAWQRPCAGLTLLSCSAALALTREFAGGVRPALRGAKALYENVEAFHVSNRGLGESPTRGGRAASGAIYIKKEPNHYDLALLCCLGRIRTLTGGTRIRRATITPQGKVCFAFAIAKLRAFAVSAKFFKHYF